MQKVVPSLSMGEFPPTNELLPWTIYFAPLSWPLLSLYPLRLCFFFSFFCAVFKSDFRAALREQLRRRRVLIISFLLKRREKSVSRAELVRREGVYRKKKNSTQKIISFFLVFVFCCCTVFTFISSFQVTDVVCFPLF